MCVCKYGCVNVQVCISVCVCESVCVHAYGYAYVNVNVRPSMCERVCMSVCKYVGVCKIFLYPLLNIGSQPHPNHDGTTVLVASMFLWGGSR